MGHGFTGIEAGASARLCSQAGAWEQEAKDLHPNPIRVERQEGNRFRFWGYIEELGGRILRVVTLEDRITIHNAFPDRGFRE
jgi:hypothetical protein